MSQLLAVGLGGFLGAIARYAITGWMHRMWQGYLPAATLAVNVVGCLMIGGLMEWVITHRGMSQSLQLLLITGFLGSLTTFSTFGYESCELMREGNLRLAGWNVAANVVIGFSAVWVGRATVQRFIT